MKLTARIKQNTSPTAKLVRRLSSGRPVFVIDLMSDATLLKRLMVAARKTGRSMDFHRIDYKIALNSLQ